jgi:hypothetical protein
MNYQSPDKMPHSLVIVLSFYFVVLAIVFLAALFFTWPGMNHVSQLIDRLPENNRLLVTAMAASGLSSVIRSVTSLGDFVGAQRLTRHWGLFYVFAPIIGMVTGLFVYISIRGGILKADTAVDALNPYTIAAIAAVAGFLSRNILDKLAAYGAQLSRREEKPSRPARLEGDSHTHD